MSKIKVCHVTSAHDRYDTRILIKECVSLQKKEYEVFLVVNDNKEDELFNGVNIRSTRFFPENRKDRFFKSKKFLKNTVRSINADIYHLHDPDLFFLVRYLKRKNKKVVFDSHEDYPSNILEKQWIPRCFRKIVSKVFKLYEGYIIKKVDGAITCYDLTFERYTKYNKNVKMILNFPVIVSTRNILKNSFESNNIAYAGGISEQWCHEEILKALDKVKKVKYILAGSLDSNYGNRLKSSDLFNKYVDYKGIVTQAEVIENVYNQAFAGMVLLDYISQCQGKKGNMSNTKFFECMYAGLPLICTDFELWQKVVKEEECGICVNPHNINEIADAIDFLFHNKKTAQKMGENGYKAIISKYNWEIESQKLYNLYDKIVM